MDKKLVKSSFYNIFVQKENGFAIYNTRTGKLVRCLDKNASIVEGYLEQKCVEWVKDNQYIESMYENGILVDYELDEILEMEQKEESDQFGDCLRLFLLPTEQCNFRCVYCYEKFERGRMPEATQDAIIQYIEDNIHKYSGLVVSWFGGEPMEAMDIIENLSVKMIDICKKKKKAYNAGITTNGYNLTIENFRKLKKLHITEYQVTIDGLAEVHDAQRVKLDGTPTFNAIINNLLDIKSRVKSSAITIVLRTNFSKPMLDHLDEFCQLLNQHFVSDKRFKFFLQLVGDCGYVKDENVRDIFGEIKDYKWLIENYTEWFVNDLMQSLYGPDGGVCYALKKNQFLVDSAGGIRKCTCALDNNENYFGIIGENFDEQKHEKWLKTRTITKDSKCYLCKKRPICHNRQCYKAQNCLVNFLYMDKVLEVMADKKQYYEVIDGGV